MAQCEKCGSSSIMLLPEKRGKQGYQCLSCGRKWYQRPRPPMIIDTRTGRSAFLNLSTGRLLSEMPPEFSITPSVVVKSLLAAAVVWFIFCYVASMTFVSLPPDLKSLGDAEKQRVVAEFFTLSGKIAGIGAVAGIVICLITMVLAVRRSDIDDVLAEGTMPYGQAALLFPVAGISIALGVAMGFWVAPQLAASAEVLRGEAFRIVVGGIQGLLAGSFTHRTVMRFGRGLSFFGMPWEM